MNVIETDVAVIGGGGAGLSAAIAVAEQPDAPDGPDDRLELRPALKRSLKRYWAWVWTPVYSRL